MGVVNDFREFFPFPLASGILHVVPLALGPLAATEKQKPVLVSGRLQGEVEKVVSRRRIGDLDVRSRPRFDELVAERFHPAVPVLAQQFLKCRSGEASGSN